MALRTLDGPDGNAEGDEQGQPGPQLPRGLLPRGGAPQGGPPHVVRGGRRLRVKGEQLAGALRLQHAAALGQSLGVLRGPGR